MTKIPAALKKEIDADPAYKTCMLYGLNGHICDGRVTLEHTLTFGGKQIQEKWAIISLCARGHEVDSYQDAHTMVKEMNVWVALNRANAAERFAISKAVNYDAMLQRLNNKYGVWQQKFPVDKAIAHLTQRDIFSQPDAILPPKQITISALDSKNIKMIFDHCLEAEGIRYREEKIVSMALEEYAKMLEATRDIAA